MVLVTHQMQGSYATCPLRPLSWSRGFKLKQHSTALRVIGRTDRCFLIKRNLRLSVGASVQGPKVRLLQISAFKGSAQSEESGSQTNGSKVHKNSVKVSYVPKESGETVVESPNVHSVPVSFTSEANEGIAGSPAIHKLFRKWLNLLRTDSQNQVVDDVLEGTPPSEDVSQIDSTIQNKERSKILKVVYCYFLGLDATIKIPLLMFVPLFLVVNVIYGAEVSRELTPLWILGPLLVALYVKILQGLWALYVFSFRQTVKVIKNLPTYYAMAYGYVAQGKLKEDIRTRIFQSAGNINNLDYKDLSRKKMKEFEEWFMEKYLDFVESIWPYYCRTIRFLKRANLI